MFYVVSMQTVGETHPCSIFAFETKELALSNYHSTLASNYVAENLDAFAVAVLNEHGGTEVREYWEKPQPEPQPDPETVPETVPETEPESSEE